MALTPAEKMTAYRARMKEKGGKIFSITMPHEEVNAVNIIGKCSYPGLNTTDVMRKMVSETAQWNLQLLKEMDSLKTKFNADSETIELYVQNEIERKQPLKARKFLEMLSKVQG
jgi:hypothetical protein